MATIGAGERTIAERFARGTLGWAFRKLLENWPTVLLFLASSSALGYLATITAWMRPWGPAGIALLAIGAGVMTTLGLALAYSIVTKARADSSHAAHVRDALKSNGINVLATEHVRQRIQLSTFFHPFHRPTENVRFENCDLFGPAMVFFAGCNLNHCEFNQCQVVIVRGDRPITGITRFDFCNLLRCRLFSVTLVATIDGYNDFPPEMRAGLPLISDGRVGDL